MQKSAHPVDHLRTYLTDLNQIFSFGRHAGRFISDWSKDVATVTNKFWGQNNEHWMTPPSVFELAFYQDLENFLLDEHINSEENAAISWKNLVNFSQVTPIIMLHSCVLLYCYWSKIGLPSSFIALAFPNAIGTGWFMRYNFCIVHPTLRSEMSTQFTFM